MSNFRIVDRLTRFLLLPSVDDWLPERHLARFVVEVVESLDLRSMTGGIAVLARPLITLRCCWRF